MDRRNAIKNAALGTFIVKDVLSVKSIHAKQSFLKSGNQINHSVCYWCYQQIPLESFAYQCKEIGIQSIELLDPSQWQTVQSRGLTCAISNGSSLGITKGFNNPDHHEQLNQEFQDLIPMAADHGIEKIICFSGNRNGISDKEGLENCAKGLDTIIKLAAKYDIQICMELLNSRIDHIDYQCDRSSWGIALVEKLGSPNFKLLYDIYHMQIMEGDVIRTITENASYIGHYHTGGVPGRNEIDETQELYYPAIMRAIADTGFEGYVAQEFIPTKDPITSLSEGIKICDI